MLTERLLKKTSARRHTKIVDMVSKNSTMEVVHLSCATDFEHFEAFYFNTSHAALNHSSLIPWGQRCYSQVVPVEIGSRQASKMKALVVAGWMCSVTCLLGAASPNVHGRMALATSWASRRICRQEDAQNICCKTWAGHVLCQKDSTTGKRVLPKDGVIRR